LIQEKVAGNSWKRWLPGLIISAVIIYFLIHLIDINALLIALRKTNFLHVGIAFFLMVLANLMRACAWRELLGKKIRLKDSFYIINEGYLLNQIIPRSGEIGRALLVNSIVEMNFFEVLSTIIIERACDLGIAAIMFLSTIGRAIGMDWIKPLAITILSLVIVGFILLFWAVKRKEKFNIWLDHKDQNSKFFRKYITPTLKAILQGADIIQQPTRILLALFFIILCWSLWIAVSSLLMLNFIGPKPLWMVIFVQSILSFGIALPSAPAGLGVYEGTLVAALSVFSIDNELSLSFAIIMHAIQLVTIGVLGLVSLALTGSSLSALVNKVATQLKKRSKNDG